MAGIARVGVRSQSRRGGALPVWGEVVIRRLALIILRIGGGAGPGHGRVPHVIRVGHVAVRGEAPSSSRSITSSRGLQHTV